MRYMESVLAILRGGGFSIDLAHHAMHVLGSRVLGFNQELFDDSGAASIDPEMAAVMARQLAGAYPNIAELTQAVSHEGGLGGCDDDVEFAFGLDLILSGLDGLRTASNDRSRGGRQDGLGSCWRVSVRCPSRAVTGIGAGSGSANQTDHVVDVFYVGASEVPLVRQLDPGGMYPIEPDHRQQVHRRRPCGP